MDNWNEQQVDEDRLAASCCRDSYKRFLKEFMPVVMPGIDIRWNWHLDLIAEEMQALADQVIFGRPNLGPKIINISPGTSKSTATTVCFPAYVWTRMPYAKFICVSYSDLLSLELSRKGRDIVLSDKYRKFFPEIDLREDQSTKHEWANTRGGVRYCAGAGGTVTGKHGDFILIDDPIDPTMAVSPADTARINYWIKNTLSSRLVRKGVSATALIMQRLGVEDPTALFLEMKGHRHICLPARCDEGYEVKPAELEAKYIDGLMDPIGLPADFLAKQKDTHEGLGPEGYAGQYGQAPLPAEGGKFKTDKIRWGMIPKRFKRLVRAWDKAVTPDKGMGGRFRGPAFTVGFLMGEDLDGDIWFLDVKRARVDSAQRERLIHSTARRDGKGVTIAIEQEGGSGGKDSAVASARRLKGYKTILMPASGSKEARADDFSTAVNNGICIIPQQFKVGRSWKGWAKVLIEEMMYWPNSKFLDQVDAGATAHTVLIGRPKKRIGALRKRSAREHFLSRA